MRKIAMFGLALLMGCNLGCALLKAKPDCEPVSLWVKEGSTPSEFYSTKFTCIFQAQYNDPKTGPALNWNSYNECMQAHGFVPKVEE